MHLFEEAVKLALEIDQSKDYSLARNIAQQVENRDFVEDGSATKEEKKKKLWMMIARHIINEKEDTQAALKIVADSEHLSIEDILPILPDITQIGEFKEQ